MSRNTTSVDRVLLKTSDLFQILDAQFFDMIINFESNPVFLSFVKTLKAKKKFGFKINNFGNLEPCQVLSHEFLKLQTNDDFRKKQNQKSMQQILLETCGLKYTGQNYDIIVNKEDELWSKKMISKFTTSEKIIGFNIGTSEKLKTKRWDYKNFLILAKKLLRRLPEYKILVLAGPEDEEIYNSIENITHNEQFPNLILTGTNNSISQFISLVNRTKLVVSADTFGMHVAIGLNKKVIALFGPQPSQEIVLSGGGEKIVLDIDCVPCFKATPEQCVNNKQLRCMKEISPSLVFEKIITNLCL